MEEKRKVGRPKKNPEDLKNCCVMVRFTEEEVDLLKRKAEDYGMNVSECIREAIDLVYKF